APLGTDLGGSAVPRSDQNDRGKRGAVAGPALGPPHGALPALTHSLPRQTEIEAGSHRLRGTGQALTRCPILSPASFRLLEDADPRARRLLQDGERPFLDVGSRRAPGLAQLLV